MTCVMPVLAQTLPQTTTDLPLCIQVCQGSSCILVSVQACVPQLWPAVSPAASLLAVCCCDYPPGQHPDMSLRPCTERQHEQDVRDRRQLQTKLHTIKGHSAHMQRRVNLHTALCNKEL